MVVMVQISHAAVAKTKRHPWVRPGCRKRTLVPRVISKAGRWVRPDSRRVVFDISTPVCTAPAPGRGGAPRGNRNAAKYPCRDAQALARHKDACRLARLTLRLVALSKSTYK